MTRLARLVAIAAAAVAAVAALGALAMSQGSAVDGAALTALRSRALLIPVPSVPASALTDSYLQARGDIHRRAHEALDIAAPRGTPVVAVDDGHIAKLFVSKPGGITLYQFDPTSEFAYYYAHLDRYAAGLTEGAALRRGDIIGYVGSTGNASRNAPHLHFAVFRLGPERQWWRGTPINPFEIWRGVIPPSRPTR